MELLILYELWAGERLELEKGVPRYRRPGRSISVSAYPFGPGTDIWRSCMFISALFPGLRDLPLGLRRFVPCDIGANHCRLRHIGSERCGHGLTSRPRESSPEDFSNRLLVLFGYPVGSAAALLAGVLPLRYCCARFACKFRGFLTGVMFVSWFLKVLLVLVFIMMTGLVVICCLALLESGFGEALKEFDSREKHQHTLLERVQSRSRVWKRLRVSGARWCSNL